MGCGRLLLLVACVAAVLTVGFASDRSNEVAAPTEFTYLLEADVPYAAEDEDDAYALERCTLDLHRPDVEASPGARGYPTIVWFHGGGLTGGAKHVPDALANRGFAVAAVNYRLSPRVEARVCIEDAASAVAWVLGNIAERRRRPRPRLRVRPLGGRLPHEHGGARRALARGARRRSERSRRTRSAQRAHHHALHRARRTRHPRDAADRRRPRAALPRSEGRAAAASGHGRPGQGDARPLRGERLPRAHDEGRGARRDDALRVGRLRARYDRARLPARARVGRANAAASSRSAEGTPRRGLRARRAPFSSSRSARAGSGPGSCRRAPASAPST